MEQKVSLPIEVAQAGLDALRIVFNQWGVMTAPPDCLQKMQDYSHYMEDAMLNLEADKRQGQKRVTVNLEDL